MNPAAHQYLGANLHVLKKHHPQLWDFIDKNQPAPVGEVVADGNGAPDLLLHAANGQTVALREGAASPEAEAATYLQTIPENGNGVAILMGMGLGTTPLAILTQRPALRHLIVFEPEWGIFLRALESTELAALLSDPKVTLNIGPIADISKALAAAVRDIQVEDTYLLRHIPSFNYNPSLYTGLSDAVFGHVNQLNVSGSTNMRMGLRFLQNRFNNLTAIRNHRLVDSLAGILQGVPAILVGGGPSLDRNVRLLKDYQDKAVILAVDSAVPALLENGITPHFVSTIDPDDVIFEKMADYAGTSQSFSLLCLGHVTTTIPKTFPARQVFWCYSQNPIDTWNRVSLGGEVVINDVQTVAHLNLLGALTMGCSPLIFIGQDLAYTGRQDHAAHTVLTSREQMEERLQNKNDMLWVKGNCGDEVPTDRALFGMIKHFEHLIAAHPNTYINATEGGAFIQGTEILPLQEALASHCRHEKDVAASLDALQAQSSSADIQGYLLKNTALHNEVRSTMQVLENALTATATLQPKIKALVAKRKRITSFAGLPGGIQKNLALLDELNSLIDKSRILWELLIEVTLTGLRDSERLQVEIKQLAGRPERYLAWLGKNIERLDHVNTVRLEALTHLETHLAPVLDHLQKEQYLLEEEGIDTTHRLAQLYSQSGDLMLAKPYWEKLTGTPVYAAEAHFQLGCIAMQQRDSQSGQEHFGKALTLDLSWQEKIATFHEQLGSEFLQYAAVYKELGRDTYRNLLLKGLALCPAHDGLGRELFACLDADAGRAEKLLAHEPARSRQIIKKWLGIIETHHAARQLLQPQSLTRLYRLSGDAEKNLLNHDEAISFYKRALHLIPEDPALHTRLTAAFFELGDFVTGVEHLKKAVSLDRSLATHWEELGDFLSQAGQPQDALAAYEQCFVALPERTDVLGKIGACYMQMGQTEAANEAFTLSRSGRQPTNAVTVS